MKLYKRKNNKIYVWNIYNDKNYIVTEHGQEKGKMVKHKREILKGKQRRTLEEQIIFEMRSKIKKKKEDGYKEDIEDKTKIVKPMLAKTYVKKKGRGKTIEFPAYCQRKYDGLRCLVYLEDKEVKMVTRNLKEFKNLEHIKEECKKILIEKFYLDGELYTEELKFEEINGILKSKKMTEDKRNKMLKIKYHVYDCININNMKLTNKERNNILKELIKKEYKNICLVKTEIVNNHNEVLERHKEYIEEGFEGIMLRNMDGIYEINKRSRDLQKYKEFKEDEFIISGYHEEEGNNKGCVVWECKTEDKIFSVKPRGTVKYRRHLYKEGDKYIGKKLTVIYQELTGEKVPRFPVGKDIRNDI